MCGDAPTITRLIDYVKFCGSSATDKTPDLLLIPFQERLTCEVSQYANYSALWTGQGFDVSN